MTFPGLLQRTNFGKKGLQATASEGNNLYPEVEHIGLQETAG
jgi:hypothetical protein